MAKAYYCEPADAVVVNLVDGGSVAVYRNGDTTKQPGRAEEAVVWQPLLRAEEWQAIAPAPSPVGERLTEPPEVGTWVVMFNRDAFSPDIYCWHAKDAMWPRARYYRWHGEIPVEPKEPERVEPPKWLAGAIGKVKTWGNVWFAIAVVNGEVAVVTDNEHGKPQLEWCHPGFAFLVTDDPDYPPSPELAALFAEEVQ